MSILADGTIKRTIHKQAGHGPYLWAVLWNGKDPYRLESLEHSPNVSVFSFWEDAAAMRDALQANGHTASIELATDNCRTFSLKGHPNA